MKKFFHSLAIVWIAICLTIITLLLYSKYGNETYKENVGVKAVKYLYEFSNVQQLNDNMPKLEKLVTDSVYKQLTIDNTNRTLNTYLKFKGESTSVNIIRATDSYVLYSLETKYVDSTRIFIFTYSVNKNGLIEYVREMECIDFVTDLN